MRLSMQSINSKIHTSIPYCTHSHSQNAHIHTHIGKSLVRWPFHFRFNRYTQYSITTRLHFAHEIRFEAARRIIPFQSFAISVPQFHAILLFAILITEVIRFTGIPIGECNWSTICHPEEIPFVGQISAGRPEVFVSQTCERDNNKKIWIDFTIFQTKIMLFLNAP